MVLLHSMPFLSTSIDKLVAPSNSVVACRLFAEKAARLVPLSNAATKAADDEALTRTRANTSADI